jgi:hypothetical protein
MQRCVVSRSWCPANSHNPCAGAPRSPGVNRRVPKDVDARLLIRAPVRRGDHCDFVSACCCEPSVDTGRRALLLSTVCPSAAIDWTRIAGAVLAAVHDPGVTGACGNRSPAFLAPALRRGIRRMIHAGHLAAAGPEQPYRISVSGDPRGLSYLARPPNDLQPVSGLEWLLHDIDRP